MCNDYGNRVPYSAYVEAFSQLKIKLRFTPAAPNLEPRDEIWPTDRAPVIRADEAGLAKAGAELLQLPWGLAPKRPKAPVVINMRSEGRSFTRGRCLVPASHYYEFTGTTRPKTRWRFTVAGEDWFCFAGLIGRGAPAGSGEGEAFTLLTVDAGPDVAPYHDRQPAIVPRPQWSAWLDLTHPAAPLLAPSPAGSLSVVEAPRRDEDEGEQAKLV